MVVPMHSILVEILSSLHCTKQIGLAIKSTGFRLESEEWFALYWAMAKRIIYVCILCSPDSFSGNLKVNTVFLLMTSSVGYLNSLVLWSP